MPRPHERHVSARGESVDMQPAGRHPKIIMAACTDMALISSFLVRCSSNGEFREDTLRSQRDSMISERVLL